MRHRSISITSEDPENSRNIKKQQSESSERNISRSPSRKKKNKIIDINSWQNNNEIYKKKIEKIKREKNYEFNFDYLHRHEQGNTFLSDKRVESFNLKRSKETPDQKLISTSLQLNLINSTSKIIMHESLFEDFFSKEKRWKQTFKTLLKNK